MAKLDEQIASLETRLDQLKTRQQRIEARKRALLSKRARAADTRKKILVGAIVCGFHGKPGHRSTVIRAG